MALAAQGDKLEPTRPLPPVRLPTPPSLPQVPMPPPSARDLTRLASPRTNPGMWVTTDDYPAQALRLGLEGRVRTALTVVPTGRLAACAIVETSGSTSLDLATCRSLLRRARYTPATDARGMPTFATMQLAINWRLPSDDADGAVDPVPGPDAVTFVNPATPAMPLDDLVALASAADYPASLPPLTTVPSGVFLRLRVDDSGRMTSCVSGDGFVPVALVAAACEALQATARFVPGQDVSGRPAESELFTRASWGVAVLAPAPVAASPPVNP
jgi:TonB family protein